MEETVPTIHTSMVQCNIFFMTENNEASQLLVKPVPAKPDWALTARSHVQATFGDR